MQRFGAEIYVADLLVISMLRELGPLMAAILLAARSGSAFAAEIGTMKVNEEVDALTTMGLEPVRFLIVPRVIAALAMTPIVALLTNFFGLLGGAVVMRSIGFPWVTFMNRIADAGTVTDLTSGLVKAFVFGVIVASVGCLRGLGTGKGAGAVGESTTSSVVTCIVLIGITDGIFAVIFYVIGI
jgi:phospholipid/cholesterol/gamma-HCH transport system permease protein